MAPGNRKIKRQTRKEKMSEKRRKLSNISQTEENVVLSEQTNRLLSCDISTKDLTEVGCSSTTMSTENNIVADVHSSNDRATNQSINRFLPEGNRILDVGYWFKTLISHKHNASFGCSLTDMNIIKETREGFISTFTLKCTVCESVLELCSDDPDKEIDVNSAAVSGIQRTGGGHSQLTKIARALRLPAMSKDVFTESQKK